MQQSGTLFVLFHSWVELPVPARLHLKLNGGIANFSSVQGGSKIRLFQFLLYPLSMYHAKSEVSFERVHKTSANKNAIGVFFQFKHPNIFSGVYHPKTSEMKKSSGEI